MNSVASKDTKFTGLTRAVYPVYQLLDQIAAFFRMLENWRRRQQTSVQFAHLDARILRDAGISETQRFIEVNKPFN